MNEPNDPRPPDEQVGTAPGRSDETVGDAPATSGNRSSTPLLIGGVVAVLAIIAVIIGVLAK